MGATTAAMPDPESNGVSADPALVE
jgi:hypothetical protein